MATTSNQRFDWLSAVQAGERLGVTANRAYQLLRGGKKMKLGPAWFFPKERIEKLRQIRLDKKKRSL